MSIVKISLNFPSFCAISLWLIGKTATATQFCPPLKAPPNTNLTCYYPKDNRMIHCSFSWLQDGTIAYYSCIENFKQISGRITCRGYVTVENNTAVIGLDNSTQFHLPCGILTAPDLPEFHLYSYVKSPHYPLLMMDSDSDDDIEIYGLKLINSFREQHQSNALVLDELLSKKAQSWANTLASRNSLDMSTESFIGQNVYNSDQTDFKLAINDAVQFWYTEGLANYNWENVKENWNNPLALDFSQLVWKATTKLGIGAANKDSEIGTVIVTFYYPMGNIVLEDKDMPEKLFMENVLEIRNSTESQIAVRYI